MKRAAIKKVSGQKLHFYNNGLPIRVGEVLSVGRHFVTALVPTLDAYVNERMRGIEDCTIGLFERCAEGRCHFRMRVSPSSLRALADVVTSTRMQAPVYFGGEGY